LGELRTDDQVIAATEQLKNVAGKLPVEHLELSRKEVLNKLDVLRGVSNMGTLASCLQLGDAAQLLSCVLGRLVYDA